jgi:hypothetical protein
MIGKYENSSIYNEYKQVLLEQNQNDEFFLLINKIRTSSLDPATKAKLIQIVSAQKDHGIGDADAAGYASYPEAKPAIDQDDQEEQQAEDEEGWWEEQKKRSKGILAKLPF